MTGSRRIIEIMNRFGHPISYHIVEELEAQIASDISDRRMTTPDAILKEPGLFTGLAWDNYDENRETLSGSGTLHDTVGICYENIQHHVHLSAGAEMQHHNETQMWTGWNSLFEKDRLHQQRISYMENISLPPTRLDVVVETMRRSQMVAEECGDK